MRKNGKSLGHSHHSLSLLTTFAHRNVYDFGNVESIRLVVYNHFPFSSHPMHLHGHNFWVMEEGFGEWNGTLTQAQNPIRRDTQLVQKAQSFTVPAYIVLQFDTDNSGMWPFHCHLAWHVSAGLYMNILERTEEVYTERHVPEETRQTCRDWAVWSSNNVVDQIDSGL